MIKVSLHNMYMNASTTSDREFYLSEYVSWLILNVSERNDNWWYNRDKTTGRIYFITLVNAEDATAFKMVFGL